MLIFIFMAVAIGFAMWTAVRKRARRKRLREAQQSRAYRLIASVVNGTRTEPKA